MKLISLMWLFVNKICWKNRHILATLYAPICIFSIDVFFTLEKAAWLLRFQCWGVKSADHDDTAAMSGIHQIVSDICWHTKYIIYFCWPLQSTICSSVSVIGHEPFQMENGCRKYNEIPKRRTEECLYFTSVRGRLHLREIYVTWVDESVQSARKHDVMYCDVAIYNRIIRGKFQDFFSRILRKKVVFVL